jgi:hypothetical protein
MKISNLKFEISNFLCPLALCLILYLFPALIAVGGAGDILHPAVGTDSGFGFFFNRLPAFRAECRIGRQVLAAVRALIKHKLLVSAKGTESGFLWNGIPAVRAFNLLARDDNSILTRL